MLNLVRQISLRTPQYTQNHHHPSVAAAFHNAHKSYDVTFYKTGETKTAYDTREHRGKIRYSITRYQPSCRPDRRESPFSPYMFRQDESYNFHVLRCWSRKYQLGLTKRKNCILFCFFFKLQHRKLHSTLLALFVSAYTHNIKFGKHVIPRNTICGSNDVAGFIDAARTRPRLL